MRLGPPLPFDRLLWLCASPVLDARGLLLLREEAMRYDAWAGLPEAAEAHGIAPLVDAYLSSRALAHRVPRASRAQLRALALRHRRANEVRARVLAELAGAFARRRVPLLLLKGAALAFTVYERPGLRAMRDVDVLVAERDLARAGELLRELGFHAPDEASWAADRTHPHHQPARTRVVDDLVLTVEVHRRLGIADDRARCTLEELAGESEPFRIGGVEARTLGAVDALVHVHYHGFRTPLRWPDRLRLVSASDLAAMVTAWHPRIDWTRARRRAPQLRRSLAWLHALVPFPAEVADALGFDLAPAPLPVGADYRGRKRERDSERPDRWQHLVDTVLPPPWWLRLRHGGRPGALGHAASWLRHLREIA